MIILLGFPKSGTTSFHQLFLDIGLNSIHWTYKNNYIGLMIQKNKNSKLPLLTGFEKINAITQMDICISKNKSYWPQLVDYKQLYEENKNAIFILNKRTPEKILDSFKNWFNLYTRFNNYSPEFIENKTEKDFIEFVKKHYENVETFFNSIPNAKFISYDIDIDNIQKLNKYIDLKNITSLPHKNHKK